jgi:spore coat polysaccharide biosynthesis predicted glycosyltransferase SpsG
VLTAGASDPRGVTLRLLPWIAKLDVDREIHVLIGEAFVHARELARLAERLPSHLRFFPFSHDRLAAAGIAVCTFGVTAYELMFLGVPALVIGHTRENALTSRILAERCAATVDLGYVGDVREQTFKMELLDLLRDPRKQREMSAKGLEQVDGLGAERMAQRITGLAR